MRRLLIFTGLICCALNCISQEISHQESKGYLKAVDTRPVEAHNTTIDGVTYISYEVPSNPSQRFTMITYVERSLVPSHLKVPGSITYKGNSNCAVDTDPYVDYVYPLKEIGMGAFADLPQIRTITIDNVVKY